MRGLSIQAKLNDTDRALRESSFCVCPYNISFVVSFTCQWYRWLPLYEAFSLYSLQQVTQLVKGGGGRGKGEKKKKKKERNTKETKCYYDLKIQVQKCRLSLSFATTKTKGTDFCCYVEADEIPPEDETANITGALMHYSIWSLKILPKMHLTTILFYPE